MAHPQRLNGPTLTAPPTDILPLTVPKLTLLNATAGTLPAGAITGGEFVFMNSSAATPGAQTTRTAAQMYADDPLASIPGGYMLRIGNSGGGSAFTFTAGAGVTMSGTMTIAPAIFRDFMVIYGGTEATPTVTINNIGSGTFV